MSNRLRLGIAALTAALAVASAHEGGHGEEDTPSVYLDIWVGNNASTHASVNFNFAPGDNEVLLEPIQRMLGCRLEDVDSGLYDGHGYLSGFCTDGFEREGLVVRGTVNLEPIKRALPALEIDAFTLALGHPSTGFTQAAPELGEFDTDWGYGYYHYRTSPQDAVSSVEMSFGYTPQLVAIAAWALPLLLLLPAGLVWAGGRWAIHAYESRQAKVWFGFMMSANAAVLVVWAIWWGLVWKFNYHQLPPFALQVEAYSDPLYDFIRNSVWAVPPAISAVLCAGAASETTRRVGGKPLTAGDHVSQTAWVLSAIIIPALGIFTALNAFGAGRYRNFVLLLFASFIVLLILMTQAAKRRDMTPQALTQGALRDRIFELAAQSGVRLRQLHFLPKGKTQLVNAFAVGNRDVVVSQLLIEKLTKREVDAVLGHELAHLRGFHGWKILLLSSVPVAAICVVLLKLVDWIPGWAYGGLLFLFAGLAIGLVSRRMERTADAGAVALTEDAEAFITGQAKLATLNALPMEWGKGIEALLTHPSARRRIDAAAKRGGIPPERVEEMLRAPPPDDGEHYALPTPEQGHQKVLSSRAKQMALARKALLNVCAALFPPALAVGLNAEYLGLAGWTEWLFYAFVAALTVAGLFVLQKWEPASRLDGFARKIREAVEQRGFPAIALEAQPVNFAPDDKARFYEDANYWDVGCLFLTRDALSYVGEETSFCLRRDQVRRIAWRSYLPRWLAENVATIYWRDDDADRGGAFYVGQLTPVRFGKLFARRTELESRIRDWQEGAVNSDIPDSLAELGPPDIPSVTSQAPEEALSVTRLLGAALVVSFASLALGYLLDLPFAWTLGPDGAGWKLVLVTLVVQSPCLFWERHAARRGAGP